MNKLLLSLLFIIMILASCKKPERTAEGPTDVRIRNVTDANFSSVYVNTGSEDHNYGDIPAAGETDYFRFDKAYHDVVEITLQIDGQEYTTGDQDFTYAIYIGPDKATYEVDILDEVLKKLTVNIVLDGPIDD